MKKTFLSAVFVGLLIVSNTISAENDNEQIVCYEQLDTTSNCPADIKTNKNRKMLCTGKWVKANVNPNIALRTIFQFNAEADMAQNNSNSLKEINEKYRNFICFDRTRDDYLYRNYDLVDNNRTVDKLFHYYLDTNQPLELKDFEILYRKLDKNNVMSAGAFLAMPMEDRPFLSYRQKIEKVESLYNKLSKEDRKNAGNEVYRLCISSPAHECSINQHKQIVNKYKGQQKKK